MTIRKTAEKWLNGLVQELDECRKELTIRTQEMEDYRREWYQESYDVITPAYDKYTAAREVVDKLKLKIETLELYTGVLEGKPIYANEILYSDVNPYEVIEMKTDKTWVIRAMSATEKEDAKKERVDSFIPGGFVGHFDNNLQEWDITSDPNGYQLDIRFHNSKSSKGWYHGGRRFSIASEPHKFYDFNF